MIGVIPSSIKVPRLLANIIRSQYSGSEESLDTIPYSGIWDMTRNIIKVKPVHLFGVSHAKSSIRAPYVH